MRVPEHVAGPGQDDITDNEGDQGAGQSQLSVGPFLKAVDKARPQLSTPR